MRVTSRWNSPAGNPPVVTLITDRTLFASEEMSGRVAAILAAVPRGSVAIQIREKDLDGGPLVRLASEILEVARPAGAQVWINDRVDLALALETHGAHLPEAGLAIADARLVAAERSLALGASRHDEAGALAAAAEGIEVVQLGPIFATPGKHPLGPRVLGVRRRLPAKTRLVAVGGIDGAERALEARAAGADGVAVIRAAWTSDDPIATILAMIQALTS